jgi:PP-loop superfamily ATP-utilizing enzyme
MEHSFVPFSRVKESAINAEEFNAAKCFMCKKDRKSKTKQALRQISEGILSRSSFRRAKADTIFVTN